jgi:hypothetical protein
MSDFLLFANRQRSTVQFGVGKYRQRIVEIFGEIAASVT